MRDIAFLITNRYQIHHYRPIAAALPDPPTFVIEARPQDLGVDEAFVATHLPDVEIELVPKDELRSLDGMFRVILCQTPVLLHALLDKTLVVAEQYSLAKETYQYGVWRSLASLNLMYGPHPVERVGGYCAARAVGNPLFDGFFDDGTPERPPGGARGRVLYLPTYGSLSSLDDVLPHLGSIDAEVTIKLHHADAPDRLGALPANCSIVQADVHPASLLRGADVVISDYSGAAFDALYARRPLLLAGAADPTGTDFHRLSPDELERAHLLPLAVTWDPSRDFADMVDEAAEQLDDQRYEGFVDRFFVNHGQAGRACADAILEVLEHGERLDFGHRQVRARTRDLIERTRSLQAHNDILTRTNDRLRSRRGRSVVRVARAGYKRALPALARRSPFLERRVLRAKLLVARMARRRRLWSGYLRRSAHSSPAPRPAPPTDSLGITPAERRRSLVGTLIQHADEVGIELSTIEVDDRPIIAVRTTSRRPLVDLLRTASTSVPHLVVSLDQGGSPIAAAELALHHVHDVPSIDVAAPLVAGTYDGTYDELVRILFVEHDQQRNRLLALEQTAAKVDWTDQFTAGVEPASMDAPRSPHPQRPIRDVDVVYTWVDSSDPAWRRSHEEHADRAETTVESANNAERFLDREELRFSLRSLWMFAPFVRHVFLVTSGQVPAWLDRAHRGLTVVTHAEIFPDAACLPTFNSHAIEACLHRVPGLSERFLYLNDDFFLGREVTRSDFFTMGGLCRVRLAPGQFIYDGRPAPGAIPTDWAAYNAASIIQRDFGLDIDRKLQHIPYSLTTSLLREVEKRYPDEIARTRSARFRSPTDVAVPSMLAPFYAVASGRGVEWPTAADEYVYADTGRSDCVERFDRMRSVRPRFLCLNSTKHTEVPLEHQARAVRTLLEDLYPFPSPFELPGSPTEPG
jgi:hypothetical protein